MTGLVPVIHAPVAAMTAGYRVLSDSSRSAAAASDGEPESLRRTMG